MYEAGSMGRSSQDLAMDPSGVAMVARIWPTYFLDAEFSMDDPRFKLVDQLLRFFSTPVADRFLSQVQNDNGLYVLPIDIQQFQKVCIDEEFYSYLETAPKEALLCMSAAIHMAMLLKEEMDDVEKINIRLHNHPNSMVLKNMKAAYIGKLVSVCGTVVKVSTVRPLVMQMDFSCAKCGTVITRIFPDGKFSPPIVCLIQGCKSRTFSPTRSSSKQINFQKIRIQEILKYECHEEGRVPRTVECELTEDLVDSCIPGDVVTVTGIIRVINNYMDIGGDLKSWGCFDKAGTWWQEVFIKFNL